MYNVVLWVCAPLNGRYDERDGLSIDEHSIESRELESIFHNMKTTVPISPFIGMELDLTGFIDKSSVKENLWEAIEAFWSVTVQAMYVSSDSIRLCIVPYNDYEPEGTKCV